MTTSNNTLDIVKLNYVQTPFKKKEVTKATLVYFSRPRWVRGVVIGDRWKPVYRKTVGVFNTWKVNL